MKTLPPVEELLTSAEVAARFGVNRATPVHWVKTGRLTAVRTTGGHLRYRAADIAEILNRRDNQPADGAA